MKTVFGTLSRIQRRKTLFLMYITFNVQVVVAICKLEFGQIIIPATFHKKIISVASQQQAMLVLRYLICLLATTTYMQMVTLVPTALGILVVRLFAMRILLLLLLRQSYVLATLCLARFQLRQITQPILLNGMLRQIQLRERLLPQVQLFLCLQPLTIILLLLILCM